MREIVIAEFKSDHADGNVRLFQKFFGGGDFALCNEVFDILSGFLFEQFGEVFRAEIHMFRDRADADTPGKIGDDEVFSLLYITLR